MGGLRWTARILSGSCSLRHWELLVGLVERLDVVEGGHLALGDSGLGLLRGGAGASLASVGVGGLEGVALGLDVLEAIVHEATIAALVAVGAGAIDELLLREGDKLAGGPMHGALGGTGGGESPARA